MTSPSPPTAASLTSAGPPEADSTPEAGQRKAAGQLRIGDVARLVDTTPRTIRYYEEIGLLQAPPERASGQHRLYSMSEVERLREVIRLKHLLGVSLEELKRLLAAEEARSVVKAQLKRSDVGPRKRRGLLQEALGHIELQIDLVERRLGELTALREELAERHDRVEDKLKALETSAGDRRRNP